MHTTLTHPPAAEIVLALVIGTGWALHKLASLWRIHQLERQKSELLSQLWKAQVSEIETNADRYARLTAVPGVGIFVIEGEAGKMADHSDGQSTTKPNKKTKGKNQCKS